MKLIRCNKCRDVVALHYKTRFCDCGESAGRYLQDGLHAEYWGPCIPLGFHNTSFREARETQPESGWGVDFKAFVIPKSCPTFHKVDAHNPPSKLQTKRVK